MADNNATRIILSAVDQTGAAIASARKSIGSLNDSVGSLNQVLGGMVSALSVGAFAGFIKGTIDAADNMNDLSQKVGIGIRDLATWKLAADQSGTSLEAVAKGVKGLSAYMVEHGAKLRAAGITATEANGAMVQLADIFAAMPDGVQKTTLAVKLFGKSGMDMIPMLSMGSKGLAEAQAKAAAYGKKLEELAPQADEFNDMMAELGVNAQAAGMNITGYFLPGLIGMSQWLNDIAKGGKAAQDATEWMMGERAMKAMVLAGHPLLRGSGTRSVSGKIGGAAPKGMTLAEEMALADRNLAGMAAAGLLDDDAAKKAKASRGIIGPDDVLDNIREAVAKQNRADYIAGEKELADAIAASSKALNQQNEELGKQIAAAEQALETYGLTESQIADLTLARLQHARAMEAEQDADEATLAKYDREIAALERIRAAKFAVEARDTAKKEAEDAAKAWENFSRDIEHSLTDALMRAFESGDSFGEAFAESLKNTFKTMILKAAVQLTVGTVAGAAQSVTGINFGGSGSTGGSAMNLLSTGNSLYNLAAGGGMMGGFGLGAASAASELALGASFVGPSASLAGGAIGAGASAGLATGSAGAAGAMSSLAAAAPYAAAALAVASAFGLFDKKKPAPIEWALLNRPEGFNFKGAYSVWNQYSAEGPFGEVTAIGQHLKRNGQSVASLKSSVADPIVALDKVLAQYLDKDEIGTVSKAVQYKAEVEHGFTPGEVNGVMLQRLNRISNAIGGWADKLFDTTSGNIQKRYSELAQILSIRGDETAEKLAQDMFNAVGKWQYEQFAQLQAGVQRFNDMFLTDGERLDMYSDSMQNAFQKLNLVMPESRDGFKDLVEGVDTSTKAGFELYATLIDMAPAMDAYYNALQSELDIKKQLAATENNFSSAVDYRRYQRVSENYDPAFAGDYAYNISMGAIKPGSAANGDIIAELRALRSDQQAQSLAIATAQTETARILRRWNGDGMPAERVVA